MKGIKEAFIDAGEISQMLGIGMTKAYAIIKEYNAELEAKGYFTIRSWTSWRSIMTIWNFRRIICIISGFSRI